MNIETQRRLTIARALAPIFAGESNVAGVSVTGSVANGFADSFSDLELMIFWRTLPEPSFTTDLMAKQASKFLLSIPMDRKFHRNGYEDALIVSGIKVDIQHWPTDEVNSRIDAVMNLCDMSHDKQILLSNILTASVLGESAALTHWRATLSVYTGILQRKMVEQNLVIRPREWLEMLAARKEWIPFWADVLGIQKRLLLVLCGLNKVYFPGFKWSARLLESFPLKPSDASRRMSDLHGMPMQEAANEIISLVEDTLDIVEKTLPDVDVLKVRRELSLLRNQ